MTGWVVVRRRREEDSSSSSEESYDGGGGFFSGFRCPAPWLPERNKALSIDHWSQQIMDYGSGLDPIPKYIT
eukprot:scaffold1584_cov224-Chaetoceros_neogracile.AAC.7